LDGGKRLKYDYLISYSYSNEKYSGFGNLLTTHNKKINSKKDILDLKEGIENEWKINNVVILNYILIKKYWRKYK
jgi:hypothetical protein